MPVKIQAWAIPGIKVFLNKSPKSLKVPPEVILRCVAKYFSISEFNILGAKRHIPIVKARHTAVFATLFYTELTVVETGKCFGRDHTFVIHARTAIQNRLDTEPHFRKEWDELRTLIETTYLFTNHQNH